MPYLAAMSTSELLSFQKKLELKILIVDLLLFPLSSYGVFVYIYLFTPEDFINLEANVHLLFGLQVIPVFFVPIFFSFRYKYHNLDFSEKPSIKKTQAERDEEIVIFRDFLKFISLLILSYPLSILLVFDFFYRLYTVPKIYLSNKTRITH